MSKPIQGWHRKAAKEIDDKAALGELVEAVKDVLEDAEPIVGYEDEERMVETPLILRLRSAYNSALSAQEPRVCGFEKHDDRSGKYFITDCGHETWINETSETFTNCPYCGGVIKVKE